MQARKQQNELQEEYGIGIDDQEDNQIQKQADSMSQKTSFINEDPTQPANLNFKTFKKLQTSRLQQQKIRKSDHDDSDSDSDTDEHLEDCENKRGFYSDEEIEI